MKWVLSIFCLIAVAMDCNADQSTAVTLESEVAAAKAAIKEVAGTLQGELKAAMQSGGPVEAIAVCSTRAMPITGQVADDHGLNLSRVSLKNRNPANAANAWQTAVLEDFERQRLAGKDAAGLAWSEIASVGGAQEFRFMKAIPTMGVCLACHGAELSPQVTEALAEIYPQDRATGFKQGDIRGAFVVTRQLTN